MMKNTFNASYSNNSRFPQQTKPLSDGHKPSEESATPNKKSNQINLEGLLEFYKWRNHCASQGCNEKVASQLDQKNPFTLHLTDDASTSKDAASAASSIDKPPTSDCDSGDEVDENNDSDGDMFVIDEEVLQITGNPKEKENQMNNENKTTHLKSPDLVSKIYESSVRSSPPMAIPERREQPRPFQCVNVRDEILIKFYSKAYEEIDDMNVPKPRKMELFSLIRPGWHAYNEVVLDMYNKDEIPLKRVLASLPDITSEFNLQPKTNYPQR